MQATLVGYKDIFKALEIERPIWVPELALKLAQSLAGLPDKSWAKEQVDYSLKAWLKQHQVPKAEESNPLEAIQPTLTIEDRNYFEKLKDCFAILGDEKAVAQVNNLLEALPPSAADMANVKLQPKQEGASL